MGSLDDYYTALEARIKASSTEDFVRAYNRFADIVREITTEMHKRITANLPDDYEWIAFGSEKFVGWQLWASWEATEAFHLLGDGRIVYTSGRRDHRKVASTVSLKHISTPLSPSDHWKKGQLPLEVLRDLCKSVVQKPINYGFGNDPRYKGWYRDGNPPA